MRLAIALLLLIPICSGCAEALLSRVSTRSHDAYTDADFVSYAAIREIGATHKADVLATLGPPIQVLPQDRGDVFVYRRRVRDTTVVNLNPSTVSGFGPTLPVPIYFRSSTSGRDDTLMLFFDAEGRLRGDSLHLGIEGSRPAGGSEAGGSE